MPSPATSDLLRLQHLGLAARLVVEGLFSGQHRSPRKGFSVEFAEHRDYTPGVDLRHLDWKVLARRDRLYVKQYEEQTSLRLHLMLDASASMGFGGAENPEHSHSKFDFAQLCAASLAYLAQAQQDAVGLIVFDERATQRLPPRQGWGHFQAVIQALQSAAPAGATDLPGALHELAGTIQRRGLVVILSDLFSGRGDEKELLDAVGHLRHRKHEVVVMQVLAPQELRFPYDDAGEVQDIETGRVIVSDARAVREHYLRSVNNYCAAVRRGCLSRQVGYVLLDTGEPFAPALGEYLARRQRGLI